MTIAALTVPGSLGVPHVHTLHDYWLVCTHSNLLRRDGTACGNACLTAARIRRAARRPLADVFIAPSQAVFDVHSQRGLTFGRSGDRGPPGPPPTWRPGRPAGRPPAAGLRVPGPAQPQQGGGHPRRRLCAGRLEHPAAYVVGPGDVRIDRSANVDRVLELYLDALAARRTGPLRRQGGRRRRPEPGGAVSPKDEVRRS